MKNNHFIVAETDDITILIPFMQWFDALEVYKAMTHAERNETFLDEQRWNDLFICNAEGQPYDMTHITTQPRLDGTSKRVDVSRWNKRN